MQPFTYPGNIYIITGPSGTGKSTLLQRLLKEDPKLRFSVSHTTRSPRCGETDGVDYHFVTAPAFRAMIESGCFLEWAEVHGNFYGTSGAHLIERLQAGDDVLVDVDVQGGLAIKKALPSACSIFILPPEYSALEARLVARGKDSREIIQKRLHNAVAEVPFASEYDFVVVNDHFEKCLAQLRAIVSSDRQRPFRQQPTIMTILDTFPSLR